MPDTKLMQQGMRVFSELGVWNPDSLKLLEEYLISFEGLPSYKKLLFSMIWFSDMYQPLTPTRKKLVYMPGFKDIVMEENTRRAEKRAQIYMNRRKLIRTIDDQGQKRIVVTSRGEKIFYGSYPLAKLRQQKWDETWTIVMYDFPEPRRSRRDRLRYQLEKFGFGSSQLSIYISPLPLAKPIQQMIESKGYQDEVWVARAEAVLGKSNVEMAQSAWPIGVLNDLYHCLVETFTHVVDDDKLETFWKACFLAVNHQDPYLPFELLPEPWWGRDCHKLFRRVSRRGLLDAIFGWAK